MSFRLDRIATLYFASPLRGLAGKGRRIPILMYHSVARDDQPGMHGYYKTVVSPETFALQMKCLARSGYRTCSPGTALSLLGSRESVDGWFVITFDDGFLDFYDKAFPVLQNFGFGAVMYLPTAYIADSTTAFNGRDCLNWAQVRELQNHGIEFGSHTVTHPQLRPLPRAQIQTELTDSRKMIEDKTGRAVESFAYPYAFPQVDTDFKAMLKDSLEIAGYRNGVCTIVGRASEESNPFFLERLPVNELDDEPFLEAKMRGAYDWVGTAQSIAKKVSSIYGKPRPIA